MSSKMSSKCHHLDVSTVETNAGFEFPFGRRKRFPLTSKRLAFPAHFPANSNPKKCILLE